MILCSPQTGIFLDFFLQNPFIDPWDVTAARLWLYLANPISFKAHYSVVFFFWKLCNENGMSDPNIGELRFRPWVLIGIWPLLKFAL